MKREAMPMEVKYDGACITITELWLEGQVTRLEEETERLERIPRAIATRRWKCVECGDDPCIFELGLYNDKDPEQPIRHGSNITKTCPLVIESSSMGLEIEISSISPHAIWEKVR